MCRIPLVHCPHVGSRDELQLPSELRLKHTWKRLEDEEHDYIFKFDRPDVYMNYIWLEYDGKKKKAD